MENLTQNPSEVAQFHPHPASFRDPAARLYVDAQGRLLRALFEVSHKNYSHLRESGVLHTLEKKGMIIPSWPIERESFPFECSAVIESQRVPWVSYPYEWSFRMLQDGALLTLDLVSELMKRGYTLKDATAYNILFRGCKPVWVDITSLSPLRKNEPWVAYGQFCDHFLAPLFLTSFKNIPFHPFLRYQAEGLSIADTLSSLLSFRDWFRSGVLFHVLLRSRIEQRAKRFDLSRRKKVRKLKISTAQVQRNIESLRSIVSRLSVKSTGNWINYREENTYDEAMVEEKKRFVRESMDRVEQQSLAWDVGANLGTYSRILAERFASVVAIERDMGVVDQLYQELKGTPQGEKIFPIVMDMASPSPAQGWCLREQNSYRDRARPSLALYLALVHHLCLGRGIRLSSFLTEIKAISDFAVIEFVDKEDPMAQLILSTLSDYHQEYSEQTFRALLSKQGSTILSEKSLSKTRTLFFLQL